MGFDFVFGMNSFVLAFYEDSDAERIHVLAFFKGQSVRSELGTRLFPSRAILSIGFTSLYNSLVKL